jgi:hypothetical protein
VIISPAFSLSPIEKVGFKEPFFPWWKNGSVENRTKISGFSSGCFFYFNGGGVGNFLAKIPLVP